MKIIKPNSPELRELKEKAILELDRPLLEDLQEVEGQEFYLVDSFLDTLKASSEDDEEIGWVESTKFKESFMKP